MCVKQYHSPKTRYPLTPSPLTQGVCSYLEELRSQVCDRAAAAAVDDVVVVTQQLGQPKVRQLGGEAQGVAVVALEQHILWLDVAVQQLHVVQVLDTRSNLQQHLRTHNNM